MNCGQRQSDAKIYKNTPLTQDHSVFKANKNRWVQKTCSVHHIEVVLGFSEKFHRTGKM